MIHDDEVQGDGRGEERRRERIHKIFVRKTETNMSENMLN